MTSDEDRRIAESLICRIGDEPALTLRDVEEALAQRYAAGVAAALAMCREEAGSLVAGFARIVAERVVDAAERALAGRKP